jgi:thiol-disulfide isomerase/thioredoxin
MTRHRTIAGVALAISVSVLLLVGCGSTSPAAPGSSFSPSSPSSSELVFSGTTLDGQAFDLTAYKGKPVVVNFWASWCGWCAREMPDLVKFAAAHPDVTVIGVDVNDKAAAAQKFAVKYAITYPLVADEQGAIFGHFDSQGLPTTVFYDKDLNMVDKIVGATDMAGFEAGLQKAQ